MIETVSYANSWGAPKETVGKRVTFALCMSNLNCKGEPYKYGKIPAVKVDTKKDECPSCKCALYWVTLRK
jgi:hypothetical protein